jgi:putative peptidoglycan lipid II flippase
MAKSRTSGESAGLVADSRTVAAWILVSRITGFARVATMGAVLGPTFFGNVYQLTALLPNMIFTVLGGSLTTAVLVPSLVKWIDAGDDSSVRRVTNGFLGAMTAVLSVVLILSLVAAPFFLTVVTVTVNDTPIRQQQQDVGWTLLLMLLPQILLYSMAATSMALQNAHGRFAIAAAAPALENIGIIAVLCASALLFGFRTDLDTVTTPQLVLLGIGPTAAVGMHAALQWWGARGLGISLVPWAGWRDPEVRNIIWTSFKSSGYSALYNFTTLGALVVAGRIPGGVIAFQIGQNVSYLPVALSAAPLAAAQLPRLSRSFNKKDVAAFHSIFDKSLALARFVALPAAVLFFMMADILARAVAFGQMANAAGVLMVAASIASLAPGILGDAALTLSTSASYARCDTSVPIMAMMIRAAVAFIGMMLALSTMGGLAILWTLGLFLSAANLISAAFFHWNLKSPFPAEPTPRSSQLVSQLATSVISIVPGIFTAVLLTRTVGDIGGAVAAVAVAGIVYLTIQWLCGSSELGSLFSGIGRRRAR